MTKKIKSKRVILITGGAGYIGSRLIRDLATDPHFADYAIRIYDNLQRHHFCGLMDLPAEGHYEFIEGDILDNLNLERAMDDVQIVVHLAALVRTPVSFDHPEWSEQVNHWGTASVVNCALSAGVPRFIYVSSASIYGPGGPFREINTCRPVGPYALSKLKGEQEVLLGGERGLHTTILRMGTVYGNAPAMRFDATANYLVYLAGTGRPMIIHGSGEQHRPSIHIRDASASIRFCMANFSTEGEILNAVTQNPSINEIAYAIRALSPHSRLRYTDQDILTELSFTVDAAKLQKLGFKPQYTLEDGIKEMLARWQGFQPAISHTASLLESLDEA
ncbi:MAG: NAD(P)-dependent oxidoreductase [Anaerolineae bacterium]|nr:NAD(P)-dependent oxidoreductase [Anaerolineae bacterium]